MPDITMCEGRDEKRECPLRTTCHRHTAVPTPRRQAYFVGIPLLDGGHCVYYWPSKQEE